MKMRKAQDAGSITVLIILLALFMVIYVLLLPPSEREELLEGNLTETTEEEEAEEVEELLFKLESPVLLKPFAKGAVEHEIDSVSLFIRDEPLVVDLANSLFVSKSLFSEDSHDLTFNIENLDNLDKVTLFFSVVQGKGNLIIALNNVEIFDNKATGLQNVILPINLLDETNVLRFKASSPGINIFGRNSYSLRDIKVRQNFELTNTKEERTVVLSSGETGNAELSFFIFCNKADRDARLRIFVNNEEISSEVVGCVRASKIKEINKEDLKEGKNTILFEIDKGDYLLNDIKLEVVGEEGGGREYKFAITEKQFDKILDDDMEVKLLLRFEDDDEEKRAVISVNNNDFTLETEEDTYSRFITSFIEEGNNDIEITPETEFTLELLEIRLE